MVDLRRKPGGQNPDTASFGNGQADCERVKGIPACPGRCRAPHRRRKRHVTSSKIQTLQQQLGHLNLLVEEARAKEKAEALARIREQVKEYGITEVELLRAAGFVKDRPKKHPAKYYDPSSGNSWTGRGARPKWLAGKNPDDYLIRPEAKPWWPGED